MLRESKRRITPAPRPGFEVTFCDLKDMNSSAVSRRAKPSGKRWTFFANIARRNGSRTTGHSRSLRE
jgi:hypothetical protein